MSFGKGFRYYWPRLLLLTISAAAAVGVAWLAVGPSLQWRMHALLAKAFDLLPEEAVRRAYRTVARDVGLFWDTVPEPLVARVGKAGAEVESKGTVLRFNNAGMRASRNYGRKGDVYRIACVGDSFVMGTGGAEEDRWCDQLEAFYREHDIRVEGRPVEAYALALGGWTLLQSATYVTSRLSSYDPDLIVLLAVSNDITANVGVSGAGALTHSFSPEARQWGFGYFSNQPGLPFRLNYLGALTLDASPELRRQWDAAIGALRRLSELQHRRGGRPSRMTWAISPSWKSCCGRTPTSPRLRTTA